MLRVTRLAAVNEGELHIVGALVYTKENFRYSNTINVAAQVHAQGEPGGREQARAANCNLSKQSNSELQVGVTLVNTRTQRAQPGSTHACAQRSLTPLTGKLRPRRLHLRPPEQLQGSRQRGGAWLARPRGY